MSAVFRKKRKKKKKVDCGHSEQTNSHIHSSLIWVTVRQQQSVISTSSKI